MDPIRIRKVKNRDVFPLVEEWQLAYPEDHQFKYPHRWKWLYEENPYVPENEEADIPGWIALDGTNIVGWSFAMRAPGKIFNHETMIAYGLDMHVKRSHRKRNIGLRLNQANQNSHPVFIIVQMSKGSRALLEKSGARIGPPVSIFLKMFAPFDAELLRQSFMNAIYKRRFGPGFLDTLSHANRITGGAAFKILAHFFKFAVMRGNASPDYLHEGIGTANSFQFKELERFDDEVNVFWGKIRNDYDLAVSRDRKYLNWKYADHPQLTYSKYCIYKGDEMVGLLVFRIGRSPEIKIGVILELVALRNDENVIRAMLKYAELKLKAKGAVSLKCASSVPELNHVISKTGYQLVEVKTPMIYMNEDLLPFRCPDFTKTRWFMNMADHDLDLPVFNQQLSFGHLVQLSSGRVLGRDC
jgi:hypothetical protein